MKKKVLVGLSGGVDSAVSAALLTEQGYDVTGCFLCLTEDSSPDSADAQGAQDAADRLGIKLVKASYKDDFRRYVTDYFTSEYLKGKTPNPCARCNPSVKFPSLLKQAMLIGADFIATGHYARIITAADGKHLLAASPSKKDQSYFLYALPESILAKTLFPLGDFLSKDDIRKKGAELGFISATKPDSQEICFIPDDDYVSFICSHCQYTSTPGSFLNDRGEIIGTHNGIIHYTVGQRKGLGAFGEPRYVKYINAADNTVTLCGKSERYAASLTASDLIHRGDLYDGAEFEAEVKIRNTASPVSAVITVSNGIMHVNFRAPVLAPTPGQAAVVYKNGIVLGGGTIFI